jgi:hypothetical protein
MLARESTYEFAEYPWAISATFVLSVTECLSYGLITVQDTASTLYGVGKPW